MNTLQSDDNKDDAVTYMQKNRAYVAIEKAAYFDRLNTNKQAYEYASQLKNVRNRHIIYD